MAESRKLMIKLFIRTFGLLIATLLMSFYVQVQILDRMVMEANQKRSGKTDVRERFRPTFYFVERELLPYPAESWPRRLAAHKEVFTNPARIIPLAEMKASLGDYVESAQRLEAGSIVTHDIGPTSFYMMKRITGSDYVMAMEFTMPANIRAEVNAMNLTVEAAFVAVFVWLLIVFFWRDMMKLNRAADKVGEGDFSFHVELGKRAALRPLADSFNTMKDRIRSLISSHRNLTNAISHEFRTPITRLRFRHELAIDAKTLEEKDHELQLMNSAIDQLDDLSTELLEYARLDREEPKLDIAPIDVEPWLNDLAEDARELASATGRDVQISVHADCDEVDGDYRYLSRAVANLLQNAVRYARQRVELRVEMAGGKRRLQVDDDGAGIPVADRERLFEPFTRLDNSRDRQSGGSGIGLAIVKQIARWHNGSAQIGESGLGGTRVSLTW